MRAPSSSPEQPTPVFSVSEINLVAKAALEDTFAQVWIEGEVSSATYHRSGHLYFTLKDEEASLDGVMWRSGANRLPFRVEKGQKVRIRGTLTIYHRAGRYQVVADQIREAGLGDLMRSLEQLKARLVAEGLFDDAHKRELPSLPKRVGVVTSATGAAIGDIVQTIHRRAPMVDVLLSPARVQGPESAADVMRAMHALIEHGGCDLLIVGRGGGSAEDLFGFNDEALVRAIYAAEVPIISAVGHEMDFTLCDLVADRRAKTPTEAGEFAVPDIHLGLREVQSLRDRSRRALGRLTRDARLGLSDLERRLHLCHPSQKLQRSSEELRGLSARLDQSILLHLNHHRSALQGLAGRLDALSPLNVLQRGFALVRDTASGKILVNAKDAKLGGELEIQLAAGALRAQVSKIEPNTEER